MLRIALAAASGLALLVAADGAHDIYESFIAGNAADVKARTKPGLLLEGGGGDVDAAFAWFAEHAGGGDVVVLRAKGDDRYNAYIRSQGKADSVETLLLKAPAAALDPSVRDRIRNAEALFIAGGNQWDYVRMWKNSPVQGAIHHLVWRGVPIGGTSAGLAVLGEYHFSARNDTVTSKEALANPYSPKVTVEHSFLHLPHLRGVIADAHFFARDRMGRLVTFMARIARDHRKEAKGIGVDERTAVLIERNGEARVTGSGVAYFLRTHQPPSICEKGKPLTMEGIEAYRVPAGGKFNVRTWTSDAVSTYELRVRNGVLESTTGSIY